MFLLVRLRVLLTDGKEA